MDALFCTLLLKKPHKMLRKAKNNNSFLKSKMDNLCQMKNLELKET